MRRTDVKDKFRICRRDLGDTLINPYYILRDEMLSILLDHASDVLNRWNTIHLPAQVSYDEDKECKSTSNDS